MEKSKELDKLAISKISKKEVICYKNLEKYVKYPMFEVDKSHGDVRFSFIFGHSKLEELIKSDKVVEEDAMIVVISYYIMEYMLKDSIEVLVDVLTNIRDKTYIKHLYTKDKMTIYDQILHSIYGFNYEFHKEVLSNNVEHSVQEILCFEELIDYLSIGMLEILRNMSSYRLLPNDLITVDKLSNEIFDTVKKYNNDENDCDKINIFELKLVVNKLKAIKSLKNSIFNLKDTLIEKEYIQNEYERILSEAEKDVEYLKNPNDDLSNRFSEYNKSYYC